MQIQMMKQVRCEICTFKVLRYDIRPVTIACRVNLLQVVQNVQYIETVVLYDM